MRRSQKPVHMKDLDWYKLVRRYFWDDETTPYLIPVSKLHRKQADNEIFFYCIFIVLLFVGISLISMTDKAPYGRSFGASLFAFCMACSGLVLGMTKDFLAAIACTLAPASALAFALSFNLQPDMELIERLILIVFCGAWLRYAMRVINIARSYPELPEPPPDTS